MSVVELALVRAVTLDMPPTEAREVLDALSIVAVQS